MPTQKTDLLATIDQLEHSIRDAYGRAIMPKRYEGPVGSQMMRGAAVAHALWFLERARAIVNESEGDNLDGVGWCMAAASAVVLPFGIAARINVPGAGPLYMALVAPSPNKSLVSA